MITSLFGKVYKNVWIINLCLEQKIAKNKTICVMDKTIVFAFFCERLSNNKTFFGLKSIFLIYFQS